MSTHDRFGTPQIGIPEGSLGLVQTLEIRGLTTFTVEVRS